MSVAAAALKHGKGVLVIAKGPSGAGESKLELKKKNRPGLLGSNGQYYGTQTYRCGDGCSDTEWCELLEI